MTLRPFKIQSNQYKKRGTLFKIKDHRGQKISEEIKLPKKFFDKLLSYPITAFGYSIELQDKTRELSNPKFDKFQVIKALDFWIEYFVYQNKCDYILENTVNKDFELHLEELIRVREAVLKEPADTKYVRQKIRSTDPYKSQNLIEAMFKSEYERDKELIEFTENVLDSSNTPFSTVDQFCYKVKTLTRKEYEKRGKTLYNKDIAQSLLGISGDFSTIMNELQRRAMNEVPPEINDVSWAGPGIFRIEPQSPRFQLGDRIVWDVDHFRRAISTDLPSQTIRLSTETQSPEFLQWVMTNTITLPDTHHTLNPDEMFRLWNEEQDITIVHARVAEELNPGDTIRLNENREWVRALNPVNSPNFNPNIPATPALGTEPPHPSLSGGWTVREVPVTAQSITITDDESDIITYENMHLSFINGIQTGGHDNSFVTVPIAFTGNGAEIHMDLFVESGRAIIDELSSGFRNHKVQMRPSERNFLEIDGQEYHTTSVNIAHFPTGPSIMFNDLWIDTVNITVSMMNTMTVNFHQTSNSLVRTNIEITLHEPRTGALMRQSIDSDQARSWSLQMLGNNRVWIGDARADEGRGQGDVYDIREPLQINMN